jgi:hypothetical protein
MHSEPHSIMPSGTISASHLSLKTTEQTIPKREGSKLFNLLPSSDGLEGIRTPDTLVRSQVL